MLSEINLKMSWLIVAKLKRKGKERLIRNLSYISLELMDPDHK